ncbi:hypothetical protein [Cyclobacterium plantarum]|uniref:Secreted protein n=1 Tax=Cyclobacterium plantarum TaxID=2716263 RepID=A0ABX0H9E4_9BACT|nr:hypothetical protein [Cyclobacterium plantarum]NHE58476.1 hypothetical protein [Cyclobacterium plantarum]
MNYASSYLRNQIGMALVVIFCSLQWGCIEEEKPREQRSLRPVERPSVIRCNPERRKPNTNQTPSHNPSQKRLGE